MINKQIVMIYISNKNYIFSLLNFLLLLTLLLSWTAIAWADGSQSAFNITSPVSGIVKKVYVTSGQTIKKGDLLLTFDSSLILSDLNEVQAKTKLTKLNQAEAKKEFERAEELYDRTVLSEQELQQSKILYSKAVAQYAKVKNQLVHVKWLQQHSKLYATFDGKVVQVLSYSGQYVNNKLSAQTLMIIKQ